MTDTDTRLLIGHLMTALGLAFVLPLWIAGVWLLCCGTGWIFGSFFGVRRRS